MKKKITKTEKIHMRLVAELGCLVCRRISGEYVDAEVHHIGNNAMGMRSNNYQTIPLCHTHHRTGGHGVAVHAGKKTWEENYGTEQELLEETLRLLSEN